MRDLLGSGQPVTRKHGAQVPVSRESVTEDILPFPYGLPNPAELTRMPHYELGGVIQLTYRASRQWLAVPHDHESVAFFLAWALELGDLSGELKLTRWKVTIVREMARRAERALGQAIRRGQAEGIINTRGKKSGITAADAAGMGSAGTLYYLYAFAAAPNATFEKALKAARKLPVSDGGMAREHVMKILKQPVEAKEG